MQERFGFLIRFDELEGLLVIHSESCQKRAERVARTNLVFPCKELFFTTQFFKLVRKGGKRDVFFNGSNSDVIFVRRRTGSGCGGAECNKGERESDY